MMCGHCGCGSEAKASITNLQTGATSDLAETMSDHDRAHALGLPHSHDHEHGHAHDHNHDHNHDLARDHHSPVVELETRILAKNDSLAAKNRAWFAGRAHCDFRMIHHKCLVNESFSTSNAFAICLAANHLPAPRVG